MTRSPVTLGLCLILLGGCATNPNTHKPSTRPMQKSVTGVCKIGFEKPEPMSKQECFVRKGLFEQTDNPQQVIANHQPPQKSEVTIPREGMTTRPGDTPTVPVTEISADTSIANTTSEAIPDLKPVSVAASAAKTEAPAKAVEKPAPAPKPAAKPSSTKAAIDDAKDEAKVDCYLKGSDKPFQMAKSICLSGGGSLTKP